MIWPRGNKETAAQFEKDLKDVHLIYYYDAENPQTGAPEKWKYEMHFFSENRINCAYYPTLLSPSYISPISIAY